MGLLHELSFGGTWMSQEVSKCCASRLYNPCIIIIIYIYTYPIYEEDMRRFISHLLISGGTSKEWIWMPGILQGATFGRLKWVIQHLREERYTVTYCWWNKSQTTTWNGARTWVNHGIFTTNLNWWVYRISGCHQQVWIKICIFQLPHVLQKAPLKVGTDAALSSKDIGTWI